MNGAEKLPTPGIQPENKPQLPESTPDTNDQVSSATEPERAPEANTEKRGPQKRWVFTPETRSRDVDVVAAQRAALTRLWRGEEINQPTKKAQPKGLSSIGVRTDELGAAVARDYLGKVDVDQLLKTIDAEERRKIAPVLASEKGREQIEAILRELEQKPIAQVYKQNQRKTTTLIAAGVIVREAWREQAGGAVNRAKVLAQGDTINADSVLDRIIAADLLCRFSETATLEKDGKKLAEIEKAKRSGNLEKTESNLTNKQARYSKYAQSTELPDEVSERLKQAVKSYDEAAESIVREIDQAKQPKELAPEIEKSEPIRENDPARLTQEVDDIFTHGTWPEPLHEAIANHLNAIALRANSSEVTELCTGLITQSPAAMIRQSATNPRQLVMLGRLGNAIANLLVEGKETYEQDPQGYRGYHSEAIGYHLGQTLQTAAHIEYARAAELTPERREHVVNILRQPAEILPPTLKLAAQKMGEMLQHQPWQFKPQPFEVERVANGKSLKNEGLKRQQAKLTSLFEKKLDEETLTAATTLLQNRPPASYFGGDAALIQSNLSQKGMDEKVTKALSDLQTYSVKQFLQGILVNGDDARAALIVGAAIRETNPESATGALGDLICRFAQAQAIDRQVRGVTEMQSQAHVPRNIYVTSEVVPYFNQLELYANSDNIPDELQQHFKAIVAKVKPAIEETVRAKKLRVATNVIHDQDYINIYNECLDVARQQARAKSPAGGWSAQEEKKKVAKVSNQLLKTKIGAFVHAHPERTQTYIEQAARWLQAHPEAQHKKKGELLKLIKNEKNEEKRNAFIEFYRVYQFAKYAIEALPKKQRQSAAITQLQGFFREKV